MKASVEGLLVGCRGNGPLVLMNMYESCLLLSLQPTGLCEHLTQFGFPGSKKHESKLSSALADGPAGLQRKTNKTQFAFRAYKPVCSSRLI